MVAPIGWNEHVGVGVRRRHAVGCSNRHHRHGASVYDVIRDAPENVLSQSAPTVGTHRDELELVGADVVDNRRPGITLYDVRDHGYAAFLGERDTLRDERFAFFLEDVDD